MANYQLFDDNPMLSKRNFQVLVKDLFEPLVPYFESQGAAVDFKEGGAIFDMKASALEGVARPLWGIIPLVMGGGEFEYWPLYHKLIEQGTNPKHPSYWGKPKGINQRSVEMAAFGFLLAVLPEHGWDPLDDETKENLANWLASIQNCPMPQNNWLFFTVLVQAGLRKVGRSELVDINLEAEYLDKLQSYYLGDGWYGDGEVGNIDHYGGFALHYYGLIYATVLEGSNRELSELFVQRANEFCEPFSYWFANSGECLAQGRSLTYRFATAGFWGIAANAKLSAMSMSTMKGLWARQIRQWKQKSIFTTEGILNRGYDYPSLNVCEGYNSPTSPYWAFKAFIPLMLPDEHPFWTSSEEPLRLDKEIYPMPYAKSIIQRVNDHSIAHFSGPIEPQFQLDKYNKFAYSTKFGADINSLQYSNMLSFGDNIFAISFDKGANWQYRIVNEDVSVVDNVMNVRWRSGNLIVNSTIEVLDSGESIRTHRFVTEQDVWVIESGFAIGNWYQEHKIKLLEDGVGAQVKLEGDNGTSEIVSNDQHHKQAKCCCRNHSNLISPRTHVPFVLTKLTAGEHVVSSRYIATPAN
ncbi:DUF2264 domain-containing protein [Vibrio astriarenae]